MGKYRGSLTDDSQESYCYIKQAKRKEKMPIHKGI